MDFEKKIKELEELLAKAGENKMTDEDRAAIVKQIQDGLKPKAPRKMQWAVPDKSGTMPENGVTFNSFLKAITPSMAHKVAPEALQHIKTTLIEGTGSLGGYLVPVEYSNEILLLQQQDSIIRGLARIFPMSTLTRNLPKQLTDVTITWTTEGSEKTETNPTFAQLTQTAKKMAAIVKMTDELMEDETVGIDNLIKELVARAMATEEDRIAFVGDVSGLSDPFNGVLYASGVTSVTPIGANLHADDIINLIMSINAKYRAGATLVTSTHGLKLMMKLRNESGDPLWAPATATTPATIYGYPYKISDTILSTYGDSSLETAFLFGNWKNYFVSDRGGLEVKSSISATDVGSASAFMNDETWFRFKKRISLDVAQAAGFAKLLAK